MKTTLAQAWEAKGLGGMLLRETIRNRLLAKMWKDPAKMGAARRFVLSLIFAAVFVVVGLYWATRVLPLATKLDMSLTSNFALAFLMVAVLFALAVVVGQLIGRAYNEALAIGYIERYLFDHRDDEVEL